MEMKRNETAKAMTEDREFTAEETKNQSRAFEGDILRGVLESAGFAETEDEYRKIEVARKGKVLFTFRIRPLTEDEYEKCKKRNTKYVRNKQLGIKMPEDTNNVKYRSDIIYTATVEEDRKQLWDNRQIWNALGDKGADILTATDVIDIVLKPGEKAAIVEQIDQISGFEDNNFEEVVKN